MWGARCETYGKTMALEHPQPVFSPIIQLSLAIWNRKELFQACRWRKWTCRCSWGLPDLFVPSLIEGTTVSAICHNATLLNTNLAKKLSSDSHQFRSWILNLFIPGFQWAPADGTVLGRLLDPEGSLAGWNLRSPRPPREAVTEKLNFHLYYFQDEMGS